MVPFLIAIISKKGHIDTIRKGVTGAIIGEGCHEHSYIRFLHEKFLLRPNLFQKKFVGQNANI